MTPPLIADAPTSSAHSEVAASSTFAFDASSRFGDHAPPATTLRTEPRSGDVRAVEGILRATGFFSDEEVDVARQIVEERLRDGATSDYAMIFADDGTGTLVGYVCFGRIIFTRSSYDVYWIAVDPDLQGGGVGQRLLREAEAAVAARGGTQLFIETAGREQYAPTHRFYERLGFVRSHEGFKLRF